MTTVQATPQQQQALGKAQHNRRARAKLKADLKQLSTPEGMAVVADLLEDDREEFRSMRVDDLLLRLGKPRAMRCLTRARVAPFRTLEELSDRQKSLIVELLRGGEL